jgi:hypothetical protein
MVFHVWMHRARNRSEISANAEEAIDSSRRPAEKAKAKAKK